MDSIRKNVTQPADWWPAFEHAAEKAGKTLSEWIGDACKSKLPRDVAFKLSERPPANRPKKTSSATPARPLRDP